MITHNIKKIGGLIIGATLFLGATVSAQSFNDVPTSSKYYNAIETLANAKIVKGYDDGTFKPAQSVNRVEALKMILNAAQIATTTSTGDFSDVAADTWFAPFVYTAKARGMVSGDGTTGTFKPARTVIKAEFLKMALLGFNHNVSKHNEKTNVAADVSNGAWYVPYLSYARVLLVIEPDNNNKLYPEKTLSRGECAEILYQLIILKQGGNTQKYLKLTESELLNVILKLSEDNVSAARGHVNSSVTYSELALKSDPNEGIVKAAHEIALGMQNLVTAYEYGINGEAENLVIFANKAKEKAGIAYSYSTSTQPIGKKIKEYANALLEQATSN
ncbi:TPA: S-layer homology domain-containing protein [Candidatus Gracilibacteria bacterium]|nr:S-layer homology domain-containing protein [Candidatus Peregrinibacteria bacterium]HIQ56646.1 S-layer homology domain-containing protein [Candidatus Gracilibacteria bacterium]